MTQKPESRRQRRIREALESEFECSWFFKVHGGPYQAAGVPDLMGLVDGLFFAFEVKEPGEEPSRIQRETIVDMQRAGGIACVVEEPEETIDIVVRARRISKEGRMLLGSQEWVRAVLRPRYREDLDNPRFDRVHRSEVSSVSRPKDKLRDYLGTANRRKT